MCSGWGCASLEVSEDAAFCAVGPRGVEVIDLSSMRPEPGTLD